MRSLILILLVLLARDVFASANANVCAGLLAAHPAFREVRRAHLKHPALRALILQNLATDLPVVLTGGRARERRAIMEATFELYDTVGVAHVQLGPAARRDSLHSYRGGFWDAIERLTTPGAVVSFELPRRFFLDEDARLTDRARDAMTRTKAWRASWPAENRPTLIWVVPKSVARDEAFAPLANESLVINLDDRP